MCVSNWTHILIYIIQIYSETPLTPRCIALPHPWATSICPTANTNKVFETKCEVFAVSTGTAANSLALASVCKPWSAVLCHAGSHIHVDEAGACEAASGGAKLIPISGPDSKLTAESLRAQ